MPRASIRPFSGTSSNPGAAIRLRGAENLAAGIAGAGAAIGGTMARKRIEERELRERMRRERRDDAIRAEERSYREGLLAKMQEREDALRAEGRAYQEGLLKSKYEREDARFEEDWKRKLQSRQDEWEHSDKWKEAALAEARKEGSLQYLQGQSDQIQGELDDLEFKIRMGNLDPESAKGRIDALSHVKARLEAQRSATAKSLYGIDLPPESEFPQLPGAAGGAATPSGGVPSPTAPAGAAPRPGTGSEPLPPSVLETMSDDQLEAELSAANRRAFNFGIAVGMAKKHTDRAEAEIKYKIALQDVKVLTDARDARKKGRAEVAVRGQQASLFGEQLASEVNSMFPDGVPEDVQETYEAAMRRFAQDPDATPDSVRKSVLEVAERHDKSGRGERAGSMLDFIRKTASPPDAVTRESLPLSTPEQVERIFGEFSVEDLQLALKSRLMTTTERALIAGLIVQQSNTEAAGTRALKAERAGGIVRRTSEAVAGGADAVAQSAPKPDDGLDKYRALLAEDEAEASSTRDTYYGTSERVNRPGPDRAPGSRRDPDPGRRMTAGEREEDDRVQAERRAAFDKDVSEAASADINVSIPAAQRMGLRDGIRGLEFLKSLGLKLTPKEEEAVRRAKAMRRGT